MNPGNAEIGEHSHLEISVLDDLWPKVRPRMNISDDRSVAHAISTNDPAAARAYLFWLQRELENGEGLSEDTRAYWAAALAKFAAGGVTLGQAFGIERTSRGKPPTRAGGIDAVNNLIRCLHTEHGYKLADSANEPSAFEVAADLLSRYWRFNRKPYTLRDQFWKKRKT